MNAKAASRQNKHVISLENTKYIHTYKRKNKKELFTPEDHETAEHGNINEIQTRI